MSSAREYLPDKLNLTRLKTAAAECQGCHLYQRASQTVFGEGLVRSRVMLIGEQPGDKEDLVGKPFVGPAGKVLRDGLREAAIPEEKIYVTNVVKHFKWKARGKRRIHEKPNRGEIEACKPWLEAEIEVLKPEIVVCLGATAAQTLMGPSFRVTQSRGEIFESQWAPYLMATLHPSALLRIKDADERSVAFRELVQDLTKVASLLEDSHLSQ